MALICAYQFHPPIQIGGPNPADEFSWVSANDGLIPLIGMLVMIVLAVPSFYKKQVILQVLRWFRWVYLAATFLWGVVIPFLMLMSGARRSHGYAWPHIFDAYDNYLGVTLVTTVALFVLTRKVTKEAVVAGGTRA